MLFTRLVLIVVMQLVVMSSANAKVPGDLLGLQKQCKSDTLDTAIKACSRIIERKGAALATLFDAYSTRAFAYQGMGQFDNAVADFAKTIEFSKNAGKSGWELAFFYFLRGNAYRGGGDLEKAITDHSESIRLAPGWDKSYSDRGAIYFQKGDFASALDDISKVISFRPDSPRVAYAYAMRAMLQRRIGDPTKGLADANRSIELDGHSAMSLYIRAKIYELLNRKDEAAADLRAALVIDPNIGKEMEQMEQIGR